MWERVPDQDPIYWTMVCIAPTEFWPSTTDPYTMCEAPTLSAHSVRCVANALETVVRRWRQIYEYLQSRVLGVDVFHLNQDNFLNMLVDDDAFSRSKKYFWSINFIHEALQLMDDAIEQWARYCKASVEPWKNDDESGREAYWYSTSQKVLALGEKKGEAACEELRAVRKDFQDTLERIIILRDGVRTSHLVPQTHRLARRYG